MNDHMLDCMRYCSLTAKLPARRGNKRQKMQEFLQNYVTHSDVFRGDPIAALAAVRSICKLGSYHEQQAAALTLRKEMIKRGELIPGSSFKDEFECMPPRSTRKRFEQIEREHLSRVPHPQGQYEIRRGRDGAIQVHDATLGVMTKFAESLPQYQRTWVELKLRDYDLAVEEMMMAQFPSYMLKRGADGRLQFVSATPAPVAKLAPLGGLEAGPVIFDEMDLLVSPKSAKINPWDLLSVDEDGEVSKVDDFAAEYAWNCDQDVGVKNTCANCGRGSADQAFTRGKILCFSPKQSWGDKAATHCCKEWKPK